MDVFTISGGILQAYDVAFNLFSCVNQYVGLRCIVARTRSPKTPDGTGPSRRKGLFITFEGIEGSGKSTQSRALAHYLRSKGLWVLETREPGGTQVAEQIRDMLLRPDPVRDAADPLTPECEVALIAAARSQHVTNLLRPALQQGAIILCDRFTDSTLAYQGFGRGLPLSALRPLTRWMSQGLTPDLTVLLDLPVAQGLKRRLDGHEANRLDHETSAFHQRVRKGFLTLAQQHARRIHAVNASRSAQTISMHVITLVQPLIQAALRTQRVSVNPS